MPITMSDATIKDDSRQTLLSQNVDGSAVGGNYFANPGATLAGITQEFAVKVSEEIDTYTTNINSILAKLQNVENNVAFKGTGIETALNNFITGVRTVSLRYMNALKQAEVQIVNSVALAYQEQDTDVSGNINSDQSTLDSSNNFSNGS